MEQWDDLVHHVWKTLQNTPALRRIPLEDCLQNGRLGLIHAAESWDETKGSKFSTWAWNPIRWAILNGSKMAYPVSVPNSLQHALTHGYGPDVSRAWNVKRYGEQGNTPQVDAQTKYPGVRVEYNVVRTEDPPMGDLAPWELQEALASLTKKERALLRLRFWRGLSHRSLGLMYHCSYETVRERLRQVLAKLRAWPGKPCRAELVWGARRHRVPSVTSVELLEKS